MPRPKRPGAPEPKKRSRNGCWPCKARKVKCGEEHPSCVNCQRTGEECDYSIRLNWEGRKKKNPGFETILFQSPSPSSSTSRHDARRPSVARSNSSTATSLTTEGHAPSTVNFSVTGSEAKTLSRSEPLSAPAAGSSSKDHVPGPSLFVNHFAGLAGDDADEAPLCYPDLTSPIFSLLRPHSGSAATATGIQVPLSEVSRSGTARPPPCKRLRYSVDLDSPRRPSQVSSPVSLNEVASNGATSRFVFGTAGATLAPAATIDSPSTPSASSPCSDEGQTRQPPSRQAATLSSPDIRRMSVNSLLSGPPGPIAGQIVPPSHRALNASTTLYLSEITTHYGVDPGYIDLDLGKNDDMNALKAFKGSVRQDDFTGDDLEESTQRGLTGLIGYYERPVAVQIPRDLEPLPAKLRENPMNLLYFHHFMNITAVALVPHDDLQSNPYRHVLPRMAVQNDNLLSLMLAYSASHRAHLLNQAEPATRIALWVQDIFPALRTALNDPNQSISNENIATGIMLASLEIVSPTAFGYQIPWQRHLGLARELIASRPDGIRWTRSWTQEDQIRAFLWSWLAYLDLLGTLSGGRGETSTTWILDYQKDDYEDEFNEIDCIMGMTTRCVYILAKIAEVAKECDALRIQAHSGLVDASPTRNRWRPTRDIIVRAWALEDEVKRSMTLPPQPCKHLHASGNVARWGQKEMTALNEAFHWAALVHLHRRVLDKPSAHEDVQAAVLKIHACVDYMPLGGSGEASLLFPLFTAACETADGARRALIRERLKSMRGCGFTSVLQAQSLIEKVWETGQPWETLLTTEFIG